MTTWLGRHLHDHKCGPKLEGRGQRVYRRTLNCVSSSGVSVRPTTLGRVGNIKSGRRRLLPGVASRGAYLTWKPWGRLLVARTTEGHRAASRPWVMSATTPRTESATLNGGQMALAGASANTDVEPAFSRCVRLRGRLRHPGLRLPDPPRGVGRRGRRHACASVDAVVQVRAAKLHARAYTVKFFDDKTGFAPAARAAVGLDRRSGSSDQPWHKGFWARIRAPFQWTPSAAR